MVSYYLYTCLDRRDAFLKANSALNFLIFLKVRTVRKLYYSE